MKKLFIAFLLVLFLAPIASAKTAFFPRTALTGGGAGSVDQLECDARPLATGDTAIVMTSDKYFLVYRYNSTGTDAEDSPGIIVPDDRADCGGAGQWELMDLVKVAPTAYPSLILRDLDFPTTDPSVVFAGNCSASGECDSEFYNQIGGYLTKTFSVDASENEFNVHVDANFDGNDVTGINVLTVTGHIAAPIYTVEYGVETTLTQAQCFGGLIYVTAAVDINLPPGTDGMHLRVHSTGANVVSVAPHQSVPDTIYLDGVALTAGDEIDSGGAAGDWVELVYGGALNTWRTLNNSGPWVDGGVND